MDSIYQLWPVKEKVASTTLQHFLKTGAKNGKCFVTLFLFYLWYSVIVSFKCRPTLWWPAYIEVIPSYMKTTETVYNWDVSH